MAKLVLKDVNPAYDGEYDLEPENLTHRDFHTIKRISGVRRNEIMDALVADDADLIIAFSVVVLERAGIAVDENQLWDSQGGKIQLMLDEEEAAEESPPPQTPPVTSSGDDEKPSDSTTTSGSDTRTSSVSQENGQSPTGSPALGTPTTVPAFVPQISQG